MTSMNKASWGLFLAAFALATPATAQNRYSSGNERVDRMSEQGRRATEAAGYASGYMMCGRRCANVMGRATNGVYTGSRALANRYDDRLQDVGRRARERFDNRRRRR